MVFGKKRTANKKNNMITLTSIASGHSYEYAYDPNYPASQNLQRFLKEYDDEGYPLFFADEKIPNLNVRVRNADIENRMKHYAANREQKLANFDPATLDRTAQTKMEKLSKTKANTKAAKAVKPIKKEEA